MLNLTKKEYCCGCSACANICPAKSISLKEDDEGFFYPSIDQKTCVNCHLCERVCQYLKASEPSGVKPLFYAARHKDDQVRRHSRSGGLFTALTDFILARGGHVYGARLLDDFSVRHVCAQNTFERDCMRSSKYVQSDLNDTFSNVKNDLKNGLDVIFSGTSCQIGGLKNYLCAVKADMKNLYLVDILCYGVPSPLIWREYQKYCAQHYGGTLTGFVFRNKEKYGWNSYVETAFIDGKPHDSRAYKHLFLGGYALRPSCYNCLYKDLSRPSDITIGDFWGIEKVAPQLDDNGGVSLVMLHSQKGKKLFEKAAKDLVYLLTDSPGEQKALEKSCPIPPQRKLFWQLFHEKGLPFLIDQQITTSAVKPLPLGMGI